MTEAQTVQVSEAKGRPMLHWVGKRPLDHVTAFPAQLVETFNPASEQTDAQGLLFHGDNKDVLAWLLAHGYRGKVNLIYCDPPFDSGADYVRKVKLRGAVAQALSGEAHSLGEQIQYTDIWANDMYLQFMYERLLLLKELLVDDGVVALHCDDRKTHHLRCLLDEVMGAEQFVNEIIWHFPGRAMHLGTKLNRKHNSILLYSRSEAFRLCEAAQPWSREEFIQTKKQAVFTDEDGREFIWQDATGGASHAYRRYLDDVLAAGKALDDVWQISIETSSDRRRTDYPTQKPEALVMQLIRACSRPHDLVLDCFVGSGTTAAVAQKLGRVSGHAH